MSRPTIPESSLPRRETLAFDSKQSGETSAVLTQQQADAVLGSWTSTPNEAGGNIAVSVPGDRRLDLAELADQYSNVVVRLEGQVEAGELSRQDADNTRARLGQFIGRLLAEAFETKTEVALPAE